MCKSWSHDKMTAYVKHQASLQRKRLSKKRVREGKEGDPFLSVCTGVGGGDLVLSGDNVATGGDGVATTAT